jgi:hypothetical protein
VYIGRVGQRGHGFGDIFRSIFRRVVPFFKAIAPHALRAGANIVEDVTQGKSWKDSAFDHVPTVAKQVPTAWTASRPRPVPMPRSRPPQREEEEEVEQTSSSFRKRKRRCAKKKSRKRSKRDIFS